MNKKIVPCENQEFLPQEVAESEKAKLDTAQKNLLGTLCFYYLNHSIYAAEHDGWYFKDQKTLFEESNLSPAEGKRVLLKLVFKRLVERASGTNHKCTRYRLCKGIRDLMPQNPEFKTEVEDLEKMANEPLEEKSRVESSRDETRRDEGIGKNKKLEEKLCSDAVQEKEIDADKAMNHIKTELEAVQDFIQLSSTGTLLRNYVREDCEIPGLEQYLDMAIKETVNAIKASS